LSKSHWNNTGKIAWKFNKSDNYRRHVKNYCFCKSTFIQETVNDAKPFPDVLVEFNEWLDKHHLGTDKNFVIATDG
jgi:inhibitor of KinA sporulation pathway (predicted exonuclease)